jgi:thiamine biosynthesis lipoprotein
VLGTAFNNNITAVRNRADRSGVIMRDMKSLKHFTVCFLVVLLGCSGESAQTLTGETMGTTYSIKVVTSADLSNLQREIGLELKRINQLMSTYIVDSDLSLLNKSPLDVPVEVPADLITVLQLSKEIHDITNGAFDVTVGPLVTLWGFGPDKTFPDIPSPMQISQAQQRVGMQYLKLGDSSVSRGVDLYVDLSGIAKGFAVDRLCELLDGKGFHNYLVEIGGELKSAGNNDRGAPWVIAIEKPENLKRSIFRALPLRDLGMATSGDYRNYREVDGNRYSHLIDPRSGMPINHTLVSVTVLHRSAAIADALATALHVMYPEQSMVLADEQNLAVLFIIKEESGFVERRSLALEKYLVGG